MQKFKVYNQDNELMIWEITYDSVVLWLVNNNYISKDTKAYDATVEKAFGIYWYGYLCSMDVEEFNDVFEGQYRITTEDMKL